MSQTTMRVEYISWNRFARLCASLYLRIHDSGFRPDLIIAIARGGYPAARVLADYFGVMDLLALKVEHYQGPNKLRSAKVPYPFPVDITGRRVLMVDDVSDSGDTFTAALAHLDRKGPAAELRTAVLHYKRTSGVIPDYYAQKINKWRWITYPWAVVEDLAVLIERLDQKPRSVAELDRRLREAYRLTIPLRMLDHVAPALLDPAEPL